MPDRSTLQTVTMLYGAVFLLVGILGFIPGITSNYDDLDFAGNDSQAELLGIFQVSILHNLVHVLFGIAGLWLARSWDGSRAFLLGGGVIYLVLWLYGLLVSAGDDANFVPMNTADDWLHLFLGVSMILLGYLLSRGPRPVAA
jgi:hypothetical protein